MGNYRKSVLSRGFRNTSARIEMLFSVVDELYRSQIVNARRDIANEYSGSGGNIVKLEDRSEYHVRTTLRDYDRLDNLTRKLELRGL